MKRFRFQERVLANALGFVNNAFKPFRGVGRVSARGRFAGMAATLFSFLPKFRKQSTKEEPSRYPNGFNKAQEEARRLRQREQGVLPR